MRRLARSTGGSELPFLLLRLNDWVGKVREAVQRAIGPRLSPRYAGLLVENLPLVVRLKDSTRADHAPIVEAVESLLKRAECRDALLRGLGSDDRSVRRICFRLAGGAEGTEAAALYGRALADEDTVVRLWAAQQVAARLAGGAAERLLETMSRDHFMPVRREALRGFVRLLPERAPAELRRALFDPHASVREEARYHLAEKGESDFAFVYRQTLANNAERDLYSALGGIGETGTADDSAAVLPYVRHGTAKVRRAAVKALARLNGGAHLDIFLTALRDGSPSVSREARKALASRAAKVGGERLWEIFRASAVPHVRRSALYLLSRLGKWDGIYYLVRAAGDHDEETAKASRLSVVRWLWRFNRSFAQPSREQSARLKSALAERSAILDDDVIENLWFSLKGF